MAGSGLVFWTEESQTGVSKANPSGIKLPTNSELINDNRLFHVTKPLRWDISLLCPGHLSDKKKT